MGNQRHGRRVVCLGCSGAVRLRGAQLLLTAVSAHAAHVTVSVCSVRSYVTVPAAAPVTPDPGTSTYPHTPSPHMCVQARRSGGAARPPRLNAAWRCQPDTHRFLCHCEVRQALQVRGGEGRGPGRVVHSRTQSKGEGEAPGPGGSGGVHPVKGGWAGRWVVLLGGQAEETGLGAKLKSDLPCTSALSSPLTSDTPRTQGLYQLRCPDTSPLTAADCGDHTASCTGSSSSNRSGATAGSTASLAAAAATAGGEGGAPATAAAAAAAAGLRAIRPRLCDALRCADCWQQHRLLLQASAEGVLACYAAL